MICVHNVPYALLHIRYVFIQQIRRLPGFSQAGQFKEESAARISESFSGSCNTESLARKSAAEQPEFWHCFWVCFSCIFYEPLSLRVKQGIVTAVGVFIDFAVSYACKAPGTGQPLAETTDAGEHIDEFNQAPGSLWTWVLFWAYLIGTPHQKQKQPVTGCTEQDFFTVQYVSTSFFLLLFYLLLKHWNHPL